MRALIAGMVLTAGIIGGLAWADDPVIGPGKKVTLDYTLSVNNEQIETSKGKTPLVFVYGSNSIIPGLEAALKDMHVGEEKAVSVEPKDAYGLPDPKAFKEFPKSSMPKNVEPKVGMVLQAKAPDGESFPAAISAIKGDTVVLDFNHPLAGKTLKFQVKVLKIEEAPAAVSAQGGSASGGTPAVMPAVPVKKGTP